MSMHLRFTWRPNAELRLASSAPHTNPRGQLADSLETLHLMLDVDGGAKAQLELVLEPRRVDYDP